MSIVCYVTSCVTALAQVHIAQVAELEFYGRTLLRCCLKTTFLQLLVYHCIPDFLGVPSCPPTCLLAVWYGMVWYGMVAGSHSFIVITMRATDISISLVYDGSEMSLMVSNELLIHGVYLLVHGSGPLAL